MFLVSPRRLPLRGGAFDWEVGMSGAFHCPVGFLFESAADIKLFLTELSSDTVFRFVLSFQYESLYTVRDEFGISFLKEMID